MYKQPSLYSCTRRIHIRFSVSRVARFSNGITVTLFYTSEIGVYIYIFSSESIQAIYSIVVYHPVHKNKSHNPFPGFRNARERVSQPEARHTPKSFPKLLQY